MKNVKLIFRKEEEKYWKYDMVNIYFIDVLKGLVSKFYFICY